MAALTPKAEIEGEIGDFTWALRHVWMKGAIVSWRVTSRSPTRCSSSSTRIRMKIGVMFGNPETTTGGNALKILRLCSSRHPSYRRGERGRKRGGYRSRVKVGEEQNRCAV
ncbi:hypothetical protein ACNKHP_07635 [Shigella boydii]